MTIKAGVIGDPVEHSLSPRIHRYWLEKYAINGKYKAIHIRKGELKDFIKSLPERHYTGLNVTLPHKERIMEYCDHVGEIATAIGAVNTITVKPDGKIIGNNTDEYGFFHNIKEAFPAFNISDGKIVVLGAGGAARAVCASLLMTFSSKTEIYLVNRTTKRASELKDSMCGYFSQACVDKIEIVDWEQRNAVLDGAHLLVNATSLGLLGQDGLEIDLSKLPQDALVNDLIYNPLETGLLRQAKERGNKTLDGLGMLLYQAAPAFEMWFGKKPEVTAELRAFALEGL